jgi:steroid 5-alpha reductase family enzyme
MMTFLQIYLIALAVIILIMTILWLVSLRLKNSSIVDIFWGTGFVISGWLYFLLTPQGFLARKILIAALVTIWGLRLSIHIFRRNHGKPEDFRYQKWRQENGASWAWKSYFRVFLLQGILLWIISIPLLAAQYASQPARLTILDFAGILVWLVGFFFEAVGDAQLARFKANSQNRGQVLSSGVWRYTRHPNYFGDSAQWWGYFLIAAAAGGFWTIYSPLIMTLLLLRVSGVALLEKTLETRPGYKDYIHSTSAFFPLPPRKHPGGFQDRELR